MFKQKPPLTLEEFFKKFVKMELHGCLTFNGLGDMMKTLGYEFNKDQIMELIEYFDKEKMDGK